MLVSRFAALSAFLAVAIATPVNVRKRQDNSNVSTTLIAAPAPTAASGPSVSVASGISIVVPSGAAVPSASGAALPEFSGLSFPSATGLSLPALPEISGAALPEIPGLPLPEFSGAAFPEISGIALPRPTGFPGSPIIPVDTGRVIQGGPIVQGTPVISGVPTDVFDPVSFNGWGGFKSLEGFDDFHGRDNFDGWKFKQVFPHVEKKLVCKQVPKVVIVQQRLLVLQELAKKIVTETICDVEAQTVVWEQFHAGLGGFGRDIRRVPGHHQIGFDEKIVGHFPKIIKNDGHLNLDDWKFTGHDLGKNSVIVDGHNWDPKHSFGRVRNAWRATRTALGNLWFP